MTTHNWINEEAVNNIDDTWIVNNNPLIISKNNLEHPGKYHWINNISATSEKYAGWKLGKCHTYDWGRRFVIVHPEIKASIFSKRYEYDDGTQYFKKR